MIFSRSLGTSMIFLCPSIERSGAYCFTVVRLSVCTNLTFSHYSLTNLLTRLIFGMKAHLINTHLLVSRSRSSAKVKIEYKGYISQKIAVWGAFVFHKHILFFFKMTPVLFQGALWGYVALCDSSSSVYHFFHVEHFSAIPITAESRRFTHAFFYNIASAGNNLAMT